MIRGTIPVFLVFGALGLLGVLVTCLASTARAQDVPPTPDPAAEEAEDDEAEPEEPLPLRVNRAVDRACAHVLSLQEAGGGFNTTDPVHRIGRTSLSLLALLHGGVSVSEPRVVRAIDHLMTQLRAGNQTRATPETANPFSTYETGLTMMLLYDLGPEPRFTSAMEPLARYLISYVDRTTKMWAYPQGGPDLSNSQYAILGLRAAARRDIRPPGFKETLHIALIGVLSCQRKNGGFAYQPHLFARGSMTVAGLAMIHYIQEELAGYGPAAKDLARTKKAVKAAQTWLEANYSVTDHREGLARSVGYYYYFMYGLERYAAFYDLDTIGEHRWYQEGAEALIAKQNDDGGFGNSLEDTCFAILFLEKASLTIPNSRGDTGAAAAANEPPKAPKPPPEGPDAGVPAFREWLVLGPFAQTDDDDALIVDHIGEAKVRPSHGKATKAGKWMRHASPEDSVDLIKAITPNGGVPFDRVACYAAGYLIAENDCAARLWLDTDDGVRVFLNGKLVFEDHHHDGKGGLVAELALAKGANVILLKVENVGYFCRFTAKLTDPENRAMSGVTFATKLQ